MLFSLYNEKAADYDQNLADNWKEDARGVMLLVRHTIPSRPALSVNQTSLEWFVISHNCGIPISVRVVPALSNDLARCLSLLSWPDLPITCQTE